MNSVEIMDACPLCENGRPKSIATYDGSVKFFCPYCLAQIKLVEERR